MRLRLVACKTQKEGINFHEYHVPRRADIWTQFERQIEQQTQSGGSIKGITKALVKVD